MRFCKEYVEGSKPIKLGRGEVRSSCGCSTGTMNTSTSKVTACKSVCLSKKRENSSLVINIAIALQTFHSLPWLGINVQRTPIHRPYPDYAAQSPPSSRETRLPNAKATRSNSHKNPRAQQTCIPYASYLARCVFVIVSFIHFAGGVVGVHDSLQGNPMQPEAL